MSRRGGGSGAAWHLVVARGRRAWEAVQSSYWFVPSLMVVLAAAAAVGLLEADRRLGAEWVTGVRWVYSGDGDGARDVLSMIAGSMITVAGVTFSIIMVVLPLATQQYGPRLIRNFLRDPGTEVVLGTFIATFVFCTLVLRAVRTGDEGTAFVPYLSVTAGVVTALLSLAVLIYFIQHVAASIRVENVIRSAVHDVEHTLHELFPSRVGSEPDTGDAPAGGKAPGRAEGVPRPVPAGRSGYIEHLDGSGLVDLAAEHDLVVELLHRPGDYVSAGEPVARIWRAGEDADELAAKVRERLFIGRQRTPLHDLVFAAERLTEIAARALSPSTNDPFTAVNCIDELSALLVRFANVEPPSPYRCDDEGRIRLIVVPVTFPELLREVYGPLRLYGAEHPAVLEGLLQALGRIGRGCARPDVHVALREVADAIGEQVEASGLVEADRRRVRALHEVTVAALRS